MIVCLCKGVSSRTIADEARRGNCSVRAIAKSCEAGTDCGQCRPQIRKVIESVSASRHEHTDVVQLARKR